MAEYCLRTLSLSLIRIKSFVQRRTWAIPRYRYYFQRANFGTKTLSYILLLSNFLFKICSSIHHMVLNPFTPKESPFDEQSHLALDRVKSIKSLLGVKGLTISRNETLISFSKAVNIFVLSPVTDIAKLESADTVIVGSMISNIAGPGFSSTSFACLIHLSPEKLADEIQCTLRTGIKCHFHITSNLTELCMFW